MEKTNTRNNLQAATTNSRIQQLPTDGSQITSVSTPGSYLRAGERVMLQMKAAQSKGPDETQK